MAQQAGEREQLHQMEAPRGHEPLPTLPGTAETLWQG